MASIDAQLTELARIFWQTAVNDELSAILLAIGALITLVYAVIGGWLSLGAFADILTRA